MAQNRRSELPPLKDPRTIGSNRGRKYSPQIQSIGASANPPAPPRKAPQPTKRKTQPQPPTPRVKSAAPKIPEKQPATQPPSTHKGEMNKPVSSGGKHRKKERTIFKGIGTASAEDKPIVKNLGKRYSKNNHKDKYTQAVPDDVRSRLASKVKVKSYVDPTSEKHDSVKSDVVNDDPKTTNVTSGFKKYDDKGTNVLPDSSKTKEAETSSFPIKGDTPSQVQHDNNSDLQDTKDEDFTVYTEPQEDDPEGVITKSKILAPKNNIDKRKHKVPFWRIFVNVWFFLILIAMVVLGAITYVWWQNMSLDKEKSAAYQEGYVNAYAEPEMDTVVRNSEEELNNLILNTPGNGYPMNTTLSDYHLVGWSSPGGVEEHGRANLTVCYTGDGVPDKLLSHVYLVSDNANAQHPVWHVDSIDVTGNPCKVEVNKK